MADQFPSNPSGQQLLKVYLDELRSSPKALESYLGRQAGDLGYEKAPMEGMLTGSPLVNAARQLLPEKVASTQWGQKLVASLPEKTPEGVKRFVQDFGLGGYSENQLETLRAARAEDPEVARYSTEVGVVRGLDGEDVEIGQGNYRTKAAQAAGIATSDLVSDGVRNIWWFLNAPQALSYLAVQQGLHQSSERAKEDLKIGGYGEGVPLVRNRNLRMAAAVPAWMAMSMGIGNLARTPGYKAVLPSETDPTQTTDPIGEGLSRYLLGKTGQLLPYDDFVKERPDVSRSEYEAYKAYLFGNASPIKATMDGIHGPEVTFMGKSIPLATGLLPAVAAVVGARRGVARSAKRLSAEIDSATGMNRHELAVSLKNKLDAAREQQREAEYRRDVEPVSDEEIKQRYNAYRDAVDYNESEVLKSVLANSSVALTGTALAGHVLESLRRAVKGKAPIEPEEELPLA